LRHLMAIANFTKNSPEPGGNGVGRLISLGLNEFA
jgi:hypothetical protein